MFVSNESPPFPGIQSCLRVAIIHFTVFGEENGEKPKSPHESREIFDQVKKRNPQVTEFKFQKLFKEMNASFYGLSHKSA